MTVPSHPTAAGHQPADALPLPPRRQQLHVGRAGAAHLLHVPPVLTLHALRQQPGALLLRPLGRLPRARPSRQLPARQQDRGRPAAAPPSGGGHQSVQAPDGQHVLRVKGGGLTAEDRCCGVKIEVLSRPGGGDWLENRWLWFLWYRDLL